MRICELIRHQLEEVRAVMPGIPWTICVSNELQLQIEQELEVPFLMELHGERLVPSRFEAPDLVMLVPGLETSPFMSEVAIAFEDATSRHGRVRRIFVPPIGLSVEQDEIFQRLRADGVDPERATELAALM